MKKPIISGVDGLQDWPVADEYALELSRRLTALIVAEINANNGRIGFDRFMEMALYQPGLGYYSAGARKFGRDGDFTTAPETSSLFSSCVARQCEQVFDLTGSAIVLELGAGTGTMAADILTALRRRNVLPEHYMILERSAELKQRQQQLLLQRHADIFDRLVWLDTLPELPLDGIILANEVLDALPVHRLVVDNGVVYELQVHRGYGQFDWHANDAAVSGFFPEELIRGLPDGYVSEYSTQLAPFVGALSDSLDSGVMLLIDYGYPRREYYHPQRCNGTLACYYRHRSHDNPFIHVGIQDITASVDFTLLAESAHASELQVCGYTNQSGFLVSCGLERIIAEVSNDECEQSHYMQQAGKLLLPGQMGETFKVMALGRNIRDPLIGFNFGSQLHRL